MKNVKLMVAVVLIVGIAIYVFVSGAFYPQHKELTYLKLRARTAMRAELAHFKKNGSYERNVSVLPGCESDNKTVLGFKDRLPVDAAEKCGDCEIRANGFTIAAYEKGDRGFLLVTVDEGGKEEDRSFATTQ